MPLRGTAWLYAMGAQCIAASLCFFLTAVVKLPVVLYFPLSRRFSLAPAPGELSMDFYGRSLLALLAGVAAAALTLAGFRVHALLTKAGQSPGPLRPGSDLNPDSDRSFDQAAPPELEGAGAPTLTPRARGQAGAPVPPPSGRGLILLASYAATALLLAAGVYAYELYGRTPVPEPLPAGFSPLPPGFPPRSSDD